MSFPCVPMSFEHFVGQQRCFYQFCCSTAGYRQHTHIKHLNSSTLRFSYQTMLSAPVKFIQMKCCPKPLSNRFRSCLLTRNLNFVSVVSVVSSIKISRLNFFILDDDLISLRSFFFNQSSIVC